MATVFLTLFLGLIAGRQTVEVAVPTGTAAVVFLLDEAPVGRRDGPPWSTRVELGSDLLPHHLEAQALDKDGHELGRAEQWLNLPRSPAEAQIVLEAGGPGQPRRLRMAWQAVTSQAPLSVTMTLDGKPLHPDREGHLWVPPAPPGSGTRILSADLRWPDGVVAHKDVALEGEYADSVSTELTAAPVWLRKEGADLPPAAQLGGWFSAGGKSLRVEAVEAGSDQQLMVVRDPAVVRLMARWTRVRTGIDHRLQLAPGAQLQFLWPDPHQVAGPRRGGAAGGAGAAGGSGATGGGGAGGAADRDGDAGGSAGGSSVGAELFDVSQAHHVAELGLVEFIGRIEHDGPSGVPPSLADAVAVAALRAYDGGQPRAVLLVVAPDSTADASRFPPQAVRRYCAAMRVPLFVWSFGAASAALRAAWGEVADISGGGGLVQAMGELRRALDRQRIVMIGGRVLPQSIELTAAGGDVAAISSP